MHNHRDLRSAAFTTTLPTNFQADPGQTQQGKQELPYFQVSAAKMVTVLSRSTCAFFLSADGFSRRFSFSVFTSVGIRLSFPSNFSTHIYATQLHRKDNCSLIKDTEYVVSAFAVQP